MKKISQLERIQNSGSSGFYCSAFLVKEHVCSMLEVSRFCNIAG